MNEQPKELTDKMPPSHGFPVIGEVCLSLVKKVLMHVPKFRKPPLKDGMLTL